MGLAKHTVLIRSAMVANIDPLTLVLLIHRSLLFCSHGRTSSPLFEKRWYLPPLSIFSEELIKRRTHRYIWSLRRNFQNSRRLNMGTITL